MRDRRQTWTGRVAALVLLAIAPLLAVLGGGPAGAAPSGSRWGADYFPNVPLVTQDGEEVHFYDLIRDKVVAINFMFTSCQNVCPGETARLRQVQKLLGERVGHDVFMISISIDPQTDTPEVLAAYARKFRVGPGWTFLTGKDEDVTLLRKRLGLFAEEIDDDPKDHRTTLIVGNEATGRWMKRSPYDKPEVLASILGGSLHNWKVPGVIGQSYAGAARLPNLSHGEYLFRTRCSACHTMGEGDGVGPDLAGVTERREAEWLARWLAEPDAMLAEKDPIAVELFERYQKLPMPNLSLSEVDVTALIDFLTAEARRLHEAEQAQAPVDADPHAHHHH